MIGIGTPISQSRILFPLPVSRHFIGRMTGLFLCSVMEDAESLE
jgi:hypothetical protein